MQKDYTELVRYRGEREPMTDAHNFVELGCDPGEHVVRKAFDLDQ